MPPRIAAHAIALIRQWSVIGDGSGSTRSGEGSMTLSAVGVDASPSMNALATTAPIPEPQNYVLMLAGLDSWVGWDDGAAFRLREAPPPSLDDSRLADAPP